MLYIIIIIIQSGYYPYFFQIEKSWDLLIFKLLDQKFMWL